MQPSRNRGMNLEIQGQLDTQGINGSSYSCQQSDSVDDQTIGQYTQGGTQGNQNSAQNDRKVVETRKHPESSLQHPFDPVNNFLKVALTVVKRIIGKQKAALSQRIVISIKPCFLTKCELINRTLRDHLANLIIITVGLSLIISCQINTAITIAIILSVKVAIIINFKVAITP